MNGPTRSLPVILSALLLAACGGGSGSSSDASSGGQVDLAGVTRGAITAMSPGSITVNGVQISTSGAAIRIDDRNGVETELEHGMIVTVQGTFDDRGGTAAHIEFEHAVSGRVSGKSGNVLEVGGQIVRVDDTTEFGEDNPLRLGSVNVGDRIGVSGVPDDRGGLRASRIDDLSGTAEDVELKGFVSNLSATGFTIKLSPDAAQSWTVVLASGATMPAGIANGSYVEVRSIGRPQNGVITAGSVSLEDRFGNQRLDIEIEGIVTSGDASEFVVDGVTVRPTASARWEFGVPADLVPGVKVEADGRLDANGVLVAHKISYRAVVRIRAAAKNVVKSGLFSASFSVLGIPVVASDTTDWRISQLGLSENAIVELRGYPSRTNDKILVTRIEPENGDRIFLQAVVSSEDASAGSVVLLGITVASSSGTEYRDGRQGSSIDIPMTRSAFFDAVDAGRTVVKARGRDASALSGTTLIAEEMELEHDQ